MPFTFIIKHSRQRPLWSGQLWMTWCMVTLLSQISVVSTEECPLYVNEAGVNIQNCSGKDLSDLLESHISDRAEVLDFSRNKFTTLPVINESTLCPQEHKCAPNNFTHHCRRDISFSRNQIYNFTYGALSEIVCLKTLDLSFNELTAEIFHSNTFQSGVYNLHRLLLNNNPLGRLPGSVITQPFLPHLWELNLSHCDLEELDVNSLDDFAELEILDLSFNKLKTIDGRTFKGLGNLQSLDLRENQLTQLSENTFGDLVNLKVLILSHNKIQSFHSNAFYSDSKLNILDLRNNELTRVPYTALIKVNKLQSLDLSQNPIQQVTRGPPCRSLQALTLDDLPDLAELGPYSLASFPGLVSLSVSGNQALETVHPKFLGDNSNKLKYIRLENNKLSTLTGDSLPWKQLLDLRVGGNPWYCDSQLEWMIRAQSIQTDVTCTGPITLKGENIKNVNPRDLSRDYALTSATVVIIMSLCVPVVGICAVLIWRRRRYCPCVKVTLKGQYVTLFTREMDEEDDQKVAVALKVNGSKLSAISNGNADDTKPFIRLQQKSEKLVDVPDEEIV